MATTGIWKIEKRLDHVIDYISNVEKTVKLNTKSESYLELHHFKEYKNMNYITEEQCFVSGINCSIENPYQDMMLTKERFNKKDGILGFHAFQSFKKGEVTPELAHEIGIKLANEMWGDRFEVVVATHHNSGIIHNHFVINSVSFIDGKKYYDKRETYAELRHLSDMLCEEYGLSVLKEKTCEKSGINYSHYSNKYMEHSNYYTTTKRDIDYAIMQAYTYEDFETLLKRMGYEVNYRANKLTLCRKPYKKNIRVERCYGEEYSKESIIEKIKNTESIRIPFIEVYGMNKEKFYTEYEKHKKSKGIYALCLHYCYILGNFPKKTNRVLPASIRADIYKMDRLVEGIRLLDKYELKDDIQFFSFYKERKNKLDEFIKTRDKLWYEHKKEDIDKGKIIEKINSINEKIKEYRADIKVLEEIIEGQSTLKSNIEDYEKIMEGVEKKHE